MRTLPPADSHHLNAASGWLELGNASEAKIELKKISEPNRRHPAVLELRWMICAAEKDWPHALEAAQELVEVAPNVVSGWIHRSYSLHELKRTREALDLLLQAEGKFPAVGTITYNLACYACQLGDMRSARQWLVKAVRLQGKDKLKEMALIDPDLLPMRTEIKRL